MQFREAQKKAKERNWNTLQLAKSNLSNVTTITESAVTEAVISAMSHKDENAANDDNYKAESSVYAGTDMKNRYKR